MFSDPANGLFSTGFVNLEATVSKYKLTVADHSFQVRIFCFHFFVQMWYLCVVKHLHLILLNS